jgi:SAM-dependent methyltransferase
MSSELKKEYALRFASIEDYRQSVWRILVDQYFQRLIGSSGVILDLGSGWGEFVNNIRADKKYAMDLNPETATRVGRDVTFLQQDCSQEWKLPVEHLDIVFTSNFFEHLPDKNALMRTLEQAWRCLKKGGRIICLGPNIKYVANDYWDFFDHYLPLSHLSLCEALRMRDFQIESAIPRFLPYTMCHGKRPPATFLRTYLKIPLLWRFVGKQFLIVARK